MATETFRNGLRARAGNTILHDNFNTKDKFVSEEIVVKNIDVSPSGTTRWFEKDLTNKRTCKFLMHVSMVADIAGYPFKGPRNVSINNIPKPDINKTSGTLTPYSAAQDMWIKAQKTTNIYAKTLLKEMGAVVKVAANMTAFVRLIKTMSEQPNTAPAGIELSQSEILKNLLFQNIPSHGVDVGKQNPLVGYAIGGLRNKSALTLNKKTADQILLILRIRNSKPTPPAWISTLLRGIDAGLDPIFLVPLVQSYTFLSEDYDFLWFYIGTMCRVVTANDVFKNTNAALVAIIENSVKPVVGAEYIDDVITGNDYVYFFNDMLSLGRRGGLDTTAELNKLRARTKTFAESLSVATTRASMRTINDDDANREGTSDNNKIKNLLISVMSSVSFEAFSGTVKTTLTLDDYRAAHRNNPFESMCVTKIDDVKLAVLGVFKCTTLVSFDAQYMDMGIVKISSKTSTPAKYPKSITGASNILVEVSYNELLSNSKTDVSMLFRDVMGSAKTEIYRLTNNVLIKPYATVAMDAVAATSTHLADDLLETFVYGITLTDTSSLDIVPAFMMHMVLKLDGRMIVSGNISALCDDKSGFISISDQQFNGHYIDKPGMVFTIQLRSLVNFSARQTTFKVIMHNEYAIKKSGTPPTYKRATSSDL